MSEIDCFWIKVVGIFKESSKNFDDFNKICSSFSNKSPQWFKFGIIFLKEISKTAWSVKKISRTKNLTPHFPFLAKVIFCSNFHFLRVQKINLLMVVIWKTTITFTRCVQNCVMVWENLQKFRKIFDFSFERLIFLGFSLPSDWKNSFNSWIKLKFLSNSKT